MKVSEFKSKLSALSLLNFVQPNGTFVPRHFHITEVGLVTKNFMDCGGGVHKEQTAIMQIWVAEDYDHRLKPNAMLGILDKSTSILGDSDLELEVEYQTETVSIYRLEHQGENFILVPKQTDCLAKSTCGIPEKKLEMVETTSSGCCTPGGGCC